DRVGGEAGFRLLTVGDDGGLGRFEPPDGVADALVLEAGELVARQSAGGELLHPRDELRGSGDAANGFGGDRHGARLSGAVTMSMPLPPILGLRREATHGLKKVERGTGRPAVRSAFRVPRSDFEPPRLFGDDVHRPVVLGELTAHPQERLAADRGTIAL